MAKNKGGGGHSPTKGGSSSGQGGGGGGSNSNINASSSNGGGGGKERERTNSISYLPTNQLEGEALLQNAAIESEGGKPLFKPLKTFSAYSQVHGPQPLNWMIVIILTLIAGGVRLAFLTHPHEIVFDEVHFGGFASKYIASTFFFDVHPPLGKLMIAFSGVLVGYNGTFSFEKIGMDYIEHNVPYVALRFVPAIFGVALAPTAYATMRNFGFSTISSVLTALLVVFENALATQSRLILLDAFLVFFTGLTALMWSEFLRFKNEPFSIAWWRTLTFVGISLGLTVSVKWVGLFTIALIGFFTISQLWVIVTDGSIPLKVFYRHFFARVVALIFVPIGIYMFFFQVHFAVLNKMGPGSSFMSPEFQSGLIGSPIIESYADIGYGSRIMFRHEGSKGGYLHSHNHVYPAGSKQQQITCYPHKDQNSDFLVKYGLEFENNIPKEKAIVGFEKVHHGSTIRLEHIPTFKRLHSHGVRPGFTDDKDVNEVTAYGENGTLGDANDHWVVEIEGTKDESTPLLAIKTKFRLRHSQTGCYLASRNQKLPEWAFGQQEVTCSSKSRHGLTVWRVENAEHPEMPAGAKRLRYHKPSFLENFLEIHRIMWTTNNGLKSSHPYDSRPAAWPLLDRGISFWRSSGAAGDKESIYLIGNPLVWVAGSLSIVVYLAYELVDMILQKRRITFTRSGYYKDMVAGSYFYAVGYLLHYLPFFLMSRQLFLHHYLPSLYFSILAVGALFDILTFRLKSGGQLIAALAVIAVVVLVYYLFSPFTYGLAQNHDSCERLKWRKLWDFSCPAAETLE